MVEFRHDCELFLSRVDGGFLFRHDRFLVFVVVDCAIYVVIDGIFFVIIIDSFFRHRDWLRFSSSSIATFVMKCCDFRSRL